MKRVFSWTFPPPGVTTGWFNEKMASLVLQSEGFRSRVIELKLGHNRLGRSPANDFPIEHPTVSAHHCDITLGADGVVACDCNSTNGTFLDGQRIREAPLQAGQVLRLGDIELLVERTEVMVEIPKFEVPRPVPPVVRPDGSLMCPRHPHAPATHQCTHCREVLCDDCVHRLRRRGGKVLKLCPLCSRLCEPIGGEKKKKRSLLQVFQKTFKIPFLSGSKRKR